VDDGRRLFDEALRRHPESSVLYGELGRGYQNLQMHAPAIEALEKAHALDPDNCGILVDLGRAYDVAENWRGCVDMMRRALSLMTSGRRAEAALGRALASLDKCERHAGTSNPETDFFLRDRRLPLQSTDLSSGEITAYHYRELHRMLSERGVSYAAMQYPTRSVDELRKMLGDAPDVIFIENRRKFEEQCGGDRYARCFTDNFGGTFGHTTVLGHRLIAESAAEAILSRLARGK
jgi:tetratricopeptide (TPR) repeat protein